MFVAHNDRSVTAVAIILYSVTHVTNKLQQCKRFYILFCTHWVRRPLAFSGSALVLRAPQRIIGFDTLLMATCTRGINYWTRSNHGNPSDTGGWGLGAHESQNSACGTRPCERLSVPPQGVQIRQEIIELGLGNLLRREGWHGAEAVPHLEVLQEAGERFVIQSWP
jgi:hypothetical protein